jgi:hypothetical protein
MTDPAADTIPYARPVADDLSVARWLRRSVGWAAAVYGASSATAMAYFVALTRKWISAPVDLGYFSRVQDVIAWAEVTAHLLLLAAGVLVLRRARPALAALRIAAGATLLTGYAQQTHNVLAERALGFFFPYNLLYGVVAGSVLPALLIVTTLGPLGREMRRG